MIPKGAMIIMKQIIVISIFLFYSKKLDHILSHAIDKDGKNKL